MVLMVSRFNPEKDHSTLIKSISKLDANVHLVLVGDGPLKNDCEKLAQQLNLSSRIHFIGIRTDVPSIIKAADVCVLSTNWEGFGLVVVEYMICKKPVVVSDVEGVFFAHDIGVLFPKRDYIKLAEEINKLLSDGEYANIIANRCYERAKEFDIVKTASDHMNLYTSLLAK